MPDLAERDFYQFNLAGQGWSPPPTKRQDNLRHDATRVLANRAPPWARRYPSEPSCLSRVTASVRSPLAIVVSAQSADVSEFENTTFGISFIGFANGPEALGQNAAHLA